MTLFKLTRFPDVCRMCLKFNARIKTVPIDTDDPELGCSIDDFLAGMTFTVAEKNKHLLPQTVCCPCLKMLKAHARYRCRVTDIALLVNSLAELKHCNTDPIQDLFANRKDSLRVLFKEMELCSSEDVGTADLIAEFSQYDIASMSDRSGVVVKEEPQPEEDNENLFAVEFAECKLEASVNLSVAVKEEPQPEEDDEHLFAVEFAECKLEASINSGELEEATTSEEPMPEETVRPAKRKRKMCQTLASEEIEDLESALKARRYGGRKSSKLFRCDKCPYKTYYGSNFRSHQLTHLKHSIMRFRCQEPDCGAEFRLRKELDNHFTVQHKSFVCDTCGFKCGSRKKLDTHMARHLKQYNFPCEYCGKEFNEKCDLRNHIRTRHMNDRMFGCETCGNEFKLHTQLLEHVKTHNTELTYACKFCEKMYKTAKARDKHTKQTHREATHVCVHCDKAYYERYMLLDHIENKHEIQMRFICDICIQTFDSAAELATHKLRHDSPKQLECGICLMVSETFVDFAGHLCITYRDDYVCCGRDFRHHMHYNKHMLVEHGQKTNVRVKPVPGLLFGRIRAKRRHGRAPVENCPHCGATFRSHYLRKRHLELGKCLQPASGSE